MSALTADALTVRYGELVALDGVSIEVTPGRMLAVTGPSGAGKTTLLSTLAGVLTPSAGEVRWDGQAVADRDQAVARGIALVPQGNALARVLTAHENVAAPLLAAVLTRGADGSTPPVADRADAALAAVGLADAAHQLVEELSGGQQQRVAVARGLATPGPVLLADEPTSELDTVTRDVVLRLLRARADAGTAVVLATHDPDAPSWCDEVVRLDEGRVQDVDGDDDRPYRGRHVNR